MSVVIPVRDGGATVGRAVESALAADEVLHEVVVVDDGSRDDTVAVVSRIDDPRLVVVSGPARGVAAARNLGVERASGRYVVFLDCDDFGNPGWLSSLRAAVDGSELACGGVRTIDGLGATSVRVPSTDGLVWLPGAYIIERSFFIAIGGFDERLRYSENHELSLRATGAATAPVAVTDDVVVTMDRATSGSSLRHRLDAIELILDKHGPAIRSDPARHARWLGMGFVEAIKHRRPITALRFAVGGVRAHPSARQPWLRLLLALAYPLACRRHQAYPGV